MDEEYVPVVRVLWSQSKKCLEIYRGARRLSVWNGGDIQPTYWTLKLGNDEMVGCSYPEVLENVEAFLNGEI